jgi:hypothetical protein
MNMNVVEIDTNRILIKTQLKPMDFLTADGVGGFAPLAGPSGIVFMIVSTIFFSGVSCTIDKRQRQVTIERQRLLGGQHEEIAFRDLKTLMVEKQTEHDTSLEYCRIVFLLKSGEKIPLTNYRTTNARQQDKTVAAVKRFLRG